MRTGSKSRPEAPREPDSPGNDTLIRGLSPEQRARLVIDAWEPSLLRNLLRAEGSNAVLKGGNGARMKPSRTS